jgi:hypothetical protein
LTAVSALRERVSDFLRRAAHCSGAPAGQGARYFDLSENSEGFEGFLC